MLESSIRMARVLLALVAAAACAPPPAAPVAPTAPIVILVGIDGWRADYLARDAAPAVQALASAGVRAEGLIPAFPSKTFPNHYTLVTGLTPAHHGIVGNTMVDPALPGRFSLSARDVIADPRWWGGEPVWLTAERQGLSAAPYFWPGSEAPIGGRHARYWVPFDNDVPDADRVAQVLAWLRLPEADRPRFITLYFSDVDTAGHWYGPDAPETARAVAAVDEAVAGLVRGVEALGLADRVQYVLVSDHGMAAVPADHHIVLDDFLDLATVDVIEWTPLLMVAPRDGGDPEAIYRALAGRHPALHVYRRSEIPAAWGLRDHPRVPPVVAMADEGWNLVSRRETGQWTAGTRRRPAGNHGYDPDTSPTMAGLFVASGSRLRRGVVVPAFRNIHVYDLLCALLDLTPAPNDGDPGVTAGMLK
ncbi:MAG: alkaline phosphatase family protein [Vicinamibacterales bacterium]